MNLQIDHKTKLVCLDKNNNIKCFAYGEPFIFVVQSTREFHDVYGYGRIYNYPNITFNVATGEITDNRDALNFNWYKCKFITLEKYNKEYKDNYAITNN